MTEPSLSRRAALRSLLGTAAALTASGTLSREEKLLANHLAETPLPGDAQAAFVENTPTTQTEVDATSGATRTTFTLPQREALNEPVPMSHIGNVKISRLILGGNLLTGFVHSRDLIYVGELARRYNTKNKVYETLLLAEECGVNTFLAYPGVLDMFADYRKWTGGEIQYICDSRSPEQVQKSVDGGAVACYINGERTDDLVARNEFDYLASCMETTRKNGLPFGFGAHRIVTLEKLAERGVIPDFWMKTYHSDAYWSARHESEHDNIFCREPERTSAFFAGRTEPWIAFKVCAAGAIPPELGLRFAFEGGADFVCLGMYDFQLVENVNRCVEILRDLPNRTRNWMTDTLESVES